MLMKKCVSVILIFFSHANLYCSVAQRLSSVAIGEELWFLCFSGLWILSFVPAVLIRLQEGTMKPLFPVADPIPSLQ